MNLIFAEILTEIPKQGGQFRCFNKQHTQNPISPHTLPFHLKMTHTKCVWPIIVEKEKLAFKKESLPYPLKCEKKETRVLSSTFAKIRSKTFLRTQLLILSTISLNTGI